MKKNRSSFLFKNKLFFVLVLIIICVFSYFYLNVKKISTKVLENETKSTIGVTKESSPYTVYNNKENGYAITYPTKNTIVAPNSAFHLKPSDENQDYSVVSFKLNSADNLNLFPSETGALDLLSKTLSNKIQNTSLNCGDEYSQTGATPLKVKINGISFLEGNVSSEYSTSHMPIIAIEYCAIQQDHIYKLLAFFAAQSDDIYNTDVVYLLKKYSNPTINQVINSFRLINK